MNIKVGDKFLTIRKWKGRDKKNFIQSIKKDEVNENEILQSLVYDCIEEDVVLSIDEFKYVLSRIRAISIGEELSFEFYCDQCGSTNKQTFNLNDIIRYTFNDIKNIKVGNNDIKLGNVKNKEIYIKKIAEDPVYDLLLRVEKFNNDDAFTLTSLIEKFDDIDIDELNEIFQQFEDSKFKIDDVNDVKCTECGHVVKYKFDELPGFLPDDWLE